MLSTPHPDQHPLPLSIVLHLLPGMLIGSVFFALAPIVDGMGLPAIWALGIADLLVLLPFVAGLLLLEGYRRNGKLSLDGVVLYREPIGPGQYLIWVPVVFLASAIIPLLAPVSSFILERLFAGWPAMYDLSPDWGAYPRSAVIAALIFSFFTVSLAAPIVEEVYFRGYLLPRLSRFGLLAVPMHSALFALFHVWTPWMSIARAIGLMPLVYAAQRKRNIYIGMIAHVFANTLDVLTGVLFIVNVSPGPS